MGIFSDLLSRIVPKHPKVKGFLQNLPKRKQLTSRNRVHSTHINVALNSFSLDRKYRPSTKSDEQNIHSSNISSGFVVSASYKPQRWHFLSGSSVKPYWAQRRRWRRWWGCSNWACCVQGEFWRNHGILNRILRLKSEVMNCILRLRSLLALSILRTVPISLQFNLVYFFFAQPGDGDFVGDLVLVSSIILLCRDTEDTVSINLKANSNQRDSFWRWRDARELEHAKHLVQHGRRLLTLVDWYQG